MDRTFEFNEITKTTSSLSKEPLTIFEEPLAQSRKMFVRDSCDIVALHNMMFSYLS